MKLDGPGPHLFALPPGVDFGAELIRGLEQRMTGAPPEAWGRLTLFVNSGRMERHLRGLFDSGPPRLLPRIRLIDSLSSDPVPGDPPPATPLARRLELMRLVAELLAQDPDLAPRSALYDLTDSLAALLDEIEVEGVAPGTLAGLGAAEASAHWQIALRFLGIVEQLHSGDTPGPLGRLRQRAQALAKAWTDAPTPDPILVAGSTGSRGATAVFLRAVARLPRGAVVLPGFDRDLPEAVWDTLGNAAEDHPQARFKPLMDALHLTPPQVRPWTETAPANPARNRLVSLSLRPAPVTDAWLSEGRDIDPAAAAHGLTLIAAPSPRSEAETIALGLSSAAAEGRTAALITPDRTLARRVAAALDRWDVAPDDSGGEPLSLSPPGRFLRHVQDLAAGRATAPALLALLKHPLCHFGANRNAHLLATRQLELRLRRHGPAHPDPAALRDWAEMPGAPSDWALWLADQLGRLPAPARRPVPDQIGSLRAVAETLSAGPDGAVTLWDTAAGRDLREVCDSLAAHGAAAGPLHPADFAALLDGVLARTQVRRPDRGDPRILIWGTLESRVQGADLVILGGLNDGTWPELPPPDPWLNRQLRREAGLTVPERQVGLSAHDYQQAIAHPEVWLCRATRSDDAATVPSRWLNRLENLFQGLGDAGQDAWAQMAGRGARWIARAQALSRPLADVPPARRPSPRPPVAARPRRISVTEVSRLIRDPYAVYARRILNLTPLDPLVAEPDAALRGEALHAALEAFVRSGTPPDDPAALPALLAATEAALATACPWPAQRRIWAARMAQAAPAFLIGEAERRARATPTWFETAAELVLDDPPLTVTGKADRIDLLPDGRLAIYDYKTGQMPTAKQQLQFDKQLLLEAALAARGGFAEVGPAQTALAEFLPIRPGAAPVAAPLDDAPPDTVWAEFLTLMIAWRAADRGYTAQAVPFKEDDRGDYDHLARRGEWTGSDAVHPEDLT